MRTRVGFIGTGVMGQAVISTLLSAGIKREEITFTRRKLELIDEVKSKFGIEARSLEDLVRSSDLIFLAMKPQDLIALLDGIKGLLAPSTLIVSLAAGKSTKVIQSTLGGSNPVIRVMPNTPMVVGEGVSALSASENVTKEELEWIRSLLAAGGRAIVVEESLQDAVTAMSGSGPAYFFAFIEAMVKSGIELGLSESDATTLAIATIKGAAVMLEQSGKSATTLRENVTSPNGTTAAALRVFDERGLEAMVAAAMKAARDRSVELG
ncbi:MAG: pyrroline-5-carboxylate reductase, partial [Candidatus Nanopelagicaceae bacterium]